VLPKSVRRQLNIYPEDCVQVTAKQNQIEIQKQVQQQVGEKQMCYVTGISSADCQLFSGGIRLSEEAAVKLLQEWKSKQ
jgi:hypothetical protein